MNHFYSSKTTASSPTIIILWFRYRIQQPCSQYLNKTASKLILCRLLLRSCRAADGYKSLVANITMNQHLLHQSQSSRRAMVMAMVMVMALHITMNLHLSSSRLLLPRLPLAIVISCRIEQRCNHYHQNVSFCCYCRSHWDTSCSYSNRMLRRNLIFATRQAF